MSTSSLDTLVETLSHSPRLPEVVNMLQRKMEEESARRRRFYEEMTPEQKVEFIDGQVIVHSPAKNKHLGVTRRIATLLSTFVNLHDLGIVNIEKCLCTFPRNDYEPDIVFFGREKADRLEPDTIKFPVPDFIVEVLSDSTEELDRGVKFEDYAANGVGEYWIANPEELVIEQYVLRSGVYELKLKSSSGKLQGEVITGFQVEVEALFEEKANLKALRALMA